MVALRRLLALSVVRPLLLALASEVEPPRGPAKVWRSTQQTFKSFEASGVNLALWFGEDSRGGPSEVLPGAEPFELYDDFDISDKITGDESWHDLIRYRRLLERRSLSFYVDKVARKRWLPTKGYPGPRPFLLAYGHELTRSGQREDEKAEILRHLPADANYCIKPSHMSTSKGVWLVRHEADGTTRFSNNVTELAKTAFDGEQLAGRLVDILHEQADFVGEVDESWALEQVKPGIVIEELFTDVSDENVPPTEFCIFVIWGRVWVGQWNLVRGGNRWTNEFVHRNGTNVRGKRKYGPLPKWLDWQRMVDIAERLGAHKDMLRVDFFVGVPSGSSALRGASEKERVAAVQYVVSESAVHPTTEFPDEEVCEEGARLWIAGYKIGNYRLIPNAEVPPAFLTTGSCDTDSCSA